MVPSRGMEPGSRGRSDVVTEEVVPVFGGGTQSLDGGMKIAHALGHEVAGGIGVKAAVNGLALGDERAEPRRIGPGSRGGEAAMGGMKGVATDGVDGRFAQDKGLVWSGRKAEEPVIFAGGD